MSGSSPRARWAHTCTRACNSEKQSLSCSIKRRCSGAVMSALFPSMFRICSLRTRHCSNSSWFRKPSCKHENQKSWSKEHKLERLILKFVSSKTLSHRSAWVPSQFVNSSLMQRLIVQVQSKALQSPSYRKEHLALPEAENGKVVSMMLTTSTCHVHTGEGEKDHWFHIQRCFRDIIRLWMLYSHK